MTDRRTCLMWEKKTSAVGSGVICNSASDCPDPHNVNNLYTWSTGSPWNFDGTTTVFLKQLNDGAFAGHTDWRLPTSGGGSYPTGNDPELESLLTFYDCSFSCIDPVFGPAGTGSYWASSSPAAAAAWTVDFAFGSPPWGEAKTGHYYGRAVRGGP